MNDEMVKLKEDQLLPLRDLGIPILAPGLLPADLEQVHIDIREEEDGPTYRVVFHASPQRWVAVQGACGGLGDVMSGDQTEVFEAADVGSGAMEFYDLGSEEPVDFRTHWLQPDAEGASYSLSGQGLMESEALVVASSLRWLQVQYR